MPAGRASHRPEERGLPSLNQARADRKRQIVLGRARVGGIPPHWFLWGLAVLVATGVIYWYRAEAKLDSAKSEVMFKQRAVAKGLGPRIIPFRDQVEAWVMELAGPYQGDFVAQDTELGEIVKTPGAYLRLGLAQAQTKEGIRQAAQSSLRDGFTSCMFVDRRNPDPTQGAACRSTADCRSGLLCNEFQVCQRPPRPYNMRLAYRALRVLSSEWTDELHETGSELAVVAYERDLDAVTLHDVPVAIEVLTAAKYFTAVIDEKPKDGLPEPIPDAGETESERVQRVAHPARIGIWDMAKRRLLVRLREEASGRFVPVGGTRAVEPAAKAAQSRQANNCALALEVKAKIQAATTAAQQAGEAEDTAAKDGDEVEQGGRVEQGGGASGAKDAGGKDRPAQSAP